VRLPPAPPPPARSRLVSSDLRPSLPRYPRASWVDFGVDLETWGADYDCALLGVAGRWIKTPSACQLSLPPPVLPPLSLPIPRLCCSCSFAGRNGGGGGGCAVPDHLATQTRAPAPHKHLSIYITGHSVNCTPISARTQPLDRSEGARGPVPIGHTPTPGRTEDHAVPTACPVLFCSARRSLFSIRQARIRCLSGLYHMFPVSPSVTHQ
jgi:hypothetical protein